MNKNFIIQLVLTVAILSGIFYFWGGEIVNALSLLSVGFSSASFYFAIAILISAIFFEALRLLLILRTALQNPPKYSYVLRLLFVSYFAGSWLPTSVGTEVIKVLYLRRVTKETPRIITSVFADRLIGFGAMIFIICLSGIFWFPQTDSNYLFWIILLSGSLFAVLTLLYCLKGPIYHFLERFHWKYVDEALKALTMIRWNQAILFFTISIFRWGLLVSCNYLMAQALGISISFWQLLLIVPLSEFAYFAPTINGLGAREAIYVLLAQMTVTNREAIALSLSWFLCSLVLMIIGAVFFFGKDFSIQFRSNQSTTR